MKPVFKEELNYLQINPLLEGYLWVDSRCYYGFDEKFNKIKFGRKLEKLPSNANGLITHEKYCKYYYETYTESKVEFEKSKFKQYILENEYDEIIISVSGGKDSTVTHNMVYYIAKAVNKTRVLFGNTSNETHYTYKYVKDMYNDLEIANPKEGYFPWIKRNKFVPTRFTRACCAIFKEGNITPYLDNTKKLLHVCGIRRDESQSRSTYEQIRKGNWEDKLAQKNWDMYLPIINFNDLDVWSYLIVNKIKYNELYNFGWNRVGCQACPYRSDYELKLSEHFLPTYDKNWKNLIGNIFVSEGYAINMNCTKDEFINGAWKGGLFREEPTQEVVEDFAKHKGIDVEQAQKYFKSNRCNCGKRLSKDVIALNMKLLGRNTNGRMCLKCLSEFLQTDVNSLKKQINEFKNDGCNLF